MLRVIFFLLAIIASAILGIIAAPFGAYAQPQCADLTEQLAYLEKEYQEVPVARGVSGDGLMIITANEKGETWSLLYVLGKRACFKGAGEAWKILKQAPAGQPM